MKSRRVFDAAGEWTRGPCCGRLIFQRSLEAFTFFRIIVFMRCTDFQQFLMSVMGCKNQLFVAISHATKQNMLYTYGIAIVIYNAYLSSQLNYLIGILPQGLRLDGFQHAF